MTLARRAAAAALRTGAALAVLGAVIPTGAVLAGAAPATTAGSLAEIATLDGTGVARLREPSARVVGGGGRGHLRRRRRAPHRERRDQARLRRRHGESLIRSAKRRTIRFLAAARAPAERRVRPRDRHRRASRWATRGWSSRRASAPRGSSPARCAPQRRGRADAARGDRRDGGHGGRERRRSPRGAGAVRALFARRTRARRPRRRPTQLHPWTRGPVADAPADDPSAIMAVVDAPGSRKASGPNAAPAEPSRLGPVPLARDRVPGRPRRCPRRRAPPGDAGARDRVPGPSDIRVGTAGGGAARRARADALTVEAFRTRPSGSTFPAGRSPSAVRPPTLRAPTSCSENTPPTSSRGPARPSSTGAAPS